MITVLVPCNKGMPEATHVPVPDAVPDAPAAVCHVIFAIPAPAEAFPEKVADAALMVTTETAGEVTETETETDELPDGEG